MISIIHYLENKDVDSNYKLKPYVTTNKPVVVLCQSNYCGHCITAKPAYEEIASKRNDISWCSIQSEDGQLKDAVLSWYPQMRGIPCYLGFNKYGQFVKIYSGDRTAKSLSEFADSL
jgi:thiol-disulfide isomerase/thioredoxin